MIVYHYTDLDGLRGILKSNKIKSSRGGQGDAKHGDGVYFTKLDKDEDDSTIITNNWDGNPGQNARGLVNRLQAEGRVRVAIELDIRRSKLEHVSKEGDRDIWVHRGDYYLTRYGSFKVHYRKITEEAPPGDDDGGPPPQAGAGGGAQGKRPHGAQGGRNKKHRR